MTNLKLHRGLETLRVFFNSERLPSILLGFELGLFINLITDSAVRSVFDLWKILRSGKLPAELFWVFLLVLILIVPCRKLLELWRRKRGDDALLARLLAKRVEPEIAGLTHGIVTVGWSVSLKLATDLVAGWQLKKVRMWPTADAFAMPPAFRGDYLTYFRESEHSKGFQRDGDKYCLRITPKVFTDGPELNLDLQVTKYSEVCFYQDVIARRQHERKNLLELALHEKRIQTAHSLCMHAVVVTSDDLVLLTERAADVHWYPGAWSVSIEEQLSGEDSLGTEGAALRWAKRALREELSVEEVHYDERNLKALAVFLEGEILNCSIAAVLRLQIPAQELDQLLKSRPRKDYEFQAWEFFSESQLMDLMFEEKPSRALHPTSLYRVLLYLYHVKGAPALASALIHRDKAGEKRGFPEGPRLRTNLGSSSRR